VTFQARTGWSRYKEWPAERWCEVMAALPHIPFVQIGKQHDPRIAGAIHDYMGRTLRDATACSRMRRCMSASTASPIT
jgi:hypothetical protein